MALAAKSTRRWRNISLDVAASGATSAPGHIQSLACNEAGLWLIAENQTGDADDCATVLLQHVQQQVASGEDLTAAFLTAHGRLQRELPDTVGASIVAFRHARTLGTLELAWVGDMYALLLRGKQAIAIMQDKGVQQQAGGYLVATQRLKQLGSADKHRPRIDRNLVHVQRGDCLLLASSALNLNGQAQQLAGCLKGFSNLEYKSRKIQALLAKSLTQVEAGRFVLCQVN